MRKQKPKPPGSSPARIMAWITEHHAGNFTHAATALGCSYSALWRAANGHTRRGPAVAVLTALEAHTQKPITYWLGGDA